MNTTQLCMGCMQPKEETAVVCPRCGYRNEQRNPMVLPYQAVLNNKFLVGRILGNPGGFGVTYLAWDLVLHTTVAIKEYFPRQLATRSPDHSSIVLNNDKDKKQFAYGLEQFLREARTLAQFSHPNVVRVREFFQQNNTAYLVMDYYEGVSLEEFVQRKGGKISEHLAFSIMLPILAGLREVHEKKVLHRDIKPANIYLTKGDIPILLDFGAARFAIGQQSQSLSVILTAGFAPFEQYLNEPGELLGAWTDIYACGATLYAITTGILPQNAINRHQKDELISPIQIVPTLTPQLSRAIMAALTLDPEQRPQTVQALQSLLLSSEPIYNSSQPFTFAPQGTQASTNKVAFTEQDASKSPSEDLEKTVAMNTKQTHGSQRQQNSQPVINWKWLALVALVLLIGVVMIKRDQLPISQTKPAVIASNVPEASESVPDAPPTNEPPPETKLPRDAPPPRNSDFPEGEPPQPPDMAFEACVGKPIGASCLGNRGNCYTVGKKLACIPTGMPAPPPR